MNESFFMLDINTGALIFPAFLAGVLTFLAPCTLPLLPGFLAFISGTQRSADDNQSRRGPMVRNAIFYTLGFSVVFIALGSLFGLGGSALVQYRDILARIGGGLIILFGLFLLFGSNIRWLGFLQQERKFHIHHSVIPGKPLSSFLLGATFAFGWTPCIGPILGSVLLVAGTTGTVVQGMALLAVFSLGLAIPFILIAAAADSATLYIRSIQQYMSVIARIGGVFLIFMGILFLFDQLELWTSLLFRALDFINYESLIDYL